MLLNNNDTTIVGATTTTTTATTATTDLSVNAGGVKGLKVTLDTNSKNLPQLLVSLCNNHKDLFHAR